MLLTIKPTSLTPYKADISADGISPVSVSFNMRSKSTTSVIATLPKVFRDAGSAGNISILLSLFVIGASFTRESVAGKGSPRSGRAVRSGSVVVVPELNNDGDLTLYAVHGETRSPLYTSSDKALAYAHRVSEAYRDYATDLAHFVTDVMPRHKAAVDALTAVGLYSDDKVAELLPTPAAPVFVMPIDDNNVADAPKAKAKK